MKQQYVGYVLKRYKFRNNCGTIMVIWTIWSNSDHCAKIRQKSIMFRFLSKQVCTKIGFFEWISYDHRGAFYSSLHFISIIKISRILVPIEMKTQQFLFVHTKIKTVTPQKMQKVYMEIKEYIKKRRVSPLHSCF